MQAAELQRPEVHVPDPVVDFLEANVLADTHDRDAHPTAVPPNATVGTDVADFEAIRVLKWRDPVGHGARRRRVARRRCRLVQGLVRPLLVELLAKDVEAPLLRPEATRGWSGSLSLQRAMHAFMPAILRRPAGLDQLRQNTETHPP